MSVREFEAALVGQDAGPGCGFKLPFDPKGAFGKARAPVRVSVNGGPWFRTTVAVYGGAGWVGLRKDQRAELGVDVGDTVQVRIGYDDAPREVETPTELADALATDPEARAAYNSLSYSRQKEYAAWVAGAKRQETRDARAVKALQQLRGA
ncbi:YdeI/OmpD-associated family protein [Phytoactinopolyspora mesophila]|uniref:DUF1905 domain-containing protein n=1 Tax=Phytoactinopolyspora mesophila TaxID=2650750 RepID=A0A7K3MC34_9ACTN|nr:YdeI/OmpD-associated family protein [Phytoactinopolyspora mesophila]NDL60869.1 DUF1905 domain-containing protein [Phytoactinopolyspora mesophila]